MNAARSATQSHRQVRIGSPLGDDDLLFRRLTLTEGISRLYEIEVEAYSHKSDIDPDKMLGENITIGYQWYPGGPERHFNGYVTRFGLAGGRHDMAIYRFTLSPSLWFLTQTTSSRIFENEKPVDIVKKVLQDHHIDVEGPPSLSESYEYCVQYHESDFNFISRLMERHGLFYYFKHEDGAHKMVIVDNNESCPPLECHQPFPVRQPGQSLGGEVEHAESVEAVNSVLSNKVVMRDYDPLKARTSLETEKTLKKNHVAGDLRVYEHPGDYLDSGIGKERTRVAAESLQARRSVINGRGNMRGVGAGRKFTINEDGATSITGEFLAVDCTVTMEQEGYASGGSDAASFSCVFTAVPAASVYRPERSTPQPVIHGPQTAFVKNENGNELDVDEHGRIRVVFHWNQEATQSCRARVSQILAGAQWGGASWPRHGQEVIVEFIDGDPDRPIVTGRVYNSASMPPYDPKEMADVFTIKTRTIGGGGFNELQLKDEKGKEHVFLHSQKDTHLRTKEKHFERVGKEEHQTVIEKAFREVKQEQHVTIGSDSYLAVGGASHRKVTGEDLVSSDGDLVHQSSQNVHIKGGMNVIVEAGMQLTLKVGGNFVSIGPAGVDIVGTMVKINSGGAAGSGAGTKAKAATVPEEPIDGEPGIEEKPLPPAKQLPTYEQLRSHPVARALMEAAESGAPFCEKCAAAAAAASGQSSNNA